jgi:glutathione peroxidase
MHRLLATFMLLLSGAAFGACPDTLDHAMRVLGKPETASLCERYAGHPLLVVNTASHCGFTRQFKGLEQLNSSYHARGLRIAGFPSDDFRQEAKNEEETAKVCYVNYGVTFDMYAAVHVKGEQAHPLFAELARQSEAPGWNFHKYLIDREGKVVASFPSRTAPDDPELIAAIEKLL